VKAAQADKEAADAAYVKCGTDEDTLEGSCVTNNAWVFVETPIDVSATAAEKLAAVKAKLLAVSAEKATALTAAED